MVSGNTADILVSGYPTALVHRDHLQWWTNRSICKEYTPLLQEHSLLPFTDAYLKGWGAHLRHPQPVVYGIRKSQGST